MKYYEITIQLNNVVQQAKVKCCSAMQWLVANVTLKCPYFALD